jgi:hypothetical protein
MKSWATIVKTDGNVKTAELEERFTNIKNILESLYITENVEYTKDPYIIILSTSKYDKIRIEHKLFNDDFTIGFADCDIKLTGIKYEILLEKFFLAGCLEEIFKELSSMKDKKYTEYFNEVGLVLGRYKTKTRMTITEDCIEWVGNRVWGFKFTLSKTTLKWDITMSPCVHRDIEHQELIKKKPMYYIKGLLRLYDGY